jgi:hypothetical protein
MPKKIQKKAKPAEAGRRQVQISLPEQAIDELAWLCDFIGNRDGVNPSRVKSSIVRRLIRQEYNRLRHESTLQALQAPEADGR